MPLTRPYSTKQDLLLKGTELGDGEAEKFIALAADDIESALGRIYDIPLTPVAPATEFRPHIALLLKKISNLLASGRLIMASAANGDLDTTDAYGASLVREGTDLLQQIASGIIDIDAVGPGGAVADDGGPILVNHDARSGVDAFYDFATADPWGAGPVVPWAPGGGAPPWR